MITCHECLYMMKCEVVIVSLVLGDLVYLG